MIGTLHLKNTLAVLDPSGIAGQMYDAAFAFGEKEIAPLNREMDEKNQFPVQLWRMMGDRDLHGITVATPYGGVDAGYLAHMAVMEGISYHSGSVGLSYVADTNLCMNQIQLNGTEAQKQKYLPKLCTGEFVGALAMSEPEAGSDVMSMQTTATKKDGGYVLNGQKLWITNGGESDVMVVYAKTGEKLTAFIAEKDMEGFNPGKKLNKMGMRGSGTYEIFFDECFIPEENVLGEVNKGGSVLMSGLNYERLLLAAGPLGLAQSSLDFTTNYLKGRKQFGKPLIEQQAIGHKLAEMKINLDAARDAAYMTAAKAAAGIKLTNADASAVFCKASEVGAEITEECIYKCGGMGYTEDFPVEQNFRDAALYRIGGGAYDIQKEVVYRQLKLA